MSEPKKPELSEDAWRNAAGVASRAIREVEKKLGKQARLNVMIAPEQLAALRYMADVLALRSIGQAENAAQALLQFEAPKERRK